MRATHFGTKVITIAIQRALGGIRIFEKDQTATGGVQLCVFKDNSIETFAHVFAECISLEKPANYCLNDVWWRFNKLEVLGTTHQLMVEIIVENNNCYCQPNEKKRPKPMPTYKTVTLNSFFKWNCSTDAFVKIYSYFAALPFLFQDSLFAARWFGLDTNFLLM